MHSIDISVSFLWESYERNSGWMSETAKLAFFAARRLALLDLSEAASGLDMKLLALVVRSLTFRAWILCYIPAKLRLPAAQPASLEEIQKGKQWRWFTKKGITITMIFNGLTVLTKHRYCRATWAAGHWNSRQSSLGHCFWGQMRLAGVNRFGTNLSQQKEANRLKAQSTKMSQSSNSVHKLPVTVIKAQKATCSMKQVSSEDKMYLTLPKMCVACEVLLEKVLGLCTTPDLVNKRNLIRGLIKSIDIRCHALSLSILKLTLEEVFPEISRTFAHRSTRQAPIDLNQNLTLIYELKRPSNGFTKILRCLVSRLCGDLARCAHKD